MEFDTIWQVLLANGTSPRRQYEAATAWALYSPQQQQQIHDIITERIKQRLREFTERVQNGSADFSMLARLYSEDTESAKRGGELGFVGKGQLVPEFAEVAFNLNDPKRVSRIVQTEYGYHIIQLIERRGNSINARHILMIPKVNSDDQLKARITLDSFVRASVLRIK